MNPRIGTSTLIIYAHTHLQICILIYKKKSLILVTFVASEYGVGDFLSTFKLPKLCVSLHIILILCVENILFSYFYNTIVLI